MSESTPDWTDLQLFLAVARSGGLSPASRLTGRSAATLGRHMLALERALGCELFLRGERGYELTADAGKLMDALADVEGRIERLTAAPMRTEEPLVKISAGTWTTLALTRHIDQLTGTPADLRLRFVQAERTLDISRREVVIGFRNQRPVEETLACRRLRRVEFAVYARPDAPNRWIRVNASTPSAQWVRSQQGAIARCEVSTPRNSLDLALLNAGKAVLPTFIGDAEEALQPMGATIPELAHDQWIVVHQDDRQLPEVRRAIDRACEILAPPDTS